MSKFLKGQNVKLTDGSGNPILAKETSCSLSFNVNTMDESCKTDDDPEYDHQAYDNTELSATVEGNVSDPDEIINLLEIMQGTGTRFKCEANLGTCTGIDTNLTTIMSGTNAAMPTSLEIDMPAEGLATISLSLECGSDYIV